MAAAKTIKLRRYLLCAMGLLVIGFLVAWYFMRDALPREIRIATGKQGGEYYLFGETLGDVLMRTTNCRVELHPTEGSSRNRDLLAEGRVDLAILEAGFVSAEKFDIVAPLYPEPIHIVVRKGRGIEKLGDLAGRNVSLGPEGSGTLQTASRLLDHYGIEVGKLGKTDRYFTALLEDETLDAAVVTAGVEHPDLHRVLATGDFDLLPIVDARAVDMLHPNARFFEIPRGLFAERPAVPGEPVETVATTAYLVVAKDAPNALVQAVLESLYHENLRTSFPTMIRRNVASDWVTGRLHPSARGFFDPFDQVGWISSILESLAATKELLFAFGAGAYVLWLRWRKLKQHEREEVIQAQKDRLDQLLHRTLHVEAAQRETTDPKRLEELLNEVTETKLRALQEFTDEDLRGDRTFSIFLTQCSNLIMRIQLKLVEQMLAQRNTQAKS